MTNSDPSEPEKYEGIGGVVHIRQKWPPPQVSKMLEQKARTGFAQLTCEPSGRIRFNLFPNEQANTKALIERFELPAYHCRQFSNDLDGDMEKPDGTYPDKWDNRWNK